MENLRPKEIVIAHNPKPKINDTLGIHCCIICAKTPHRGTWVIRSFMMWLWSAFSNLYFCIYKLNHGSIPDPSHLTSRQTYGQESMAGALRDSPHYKMPLYFLYKILFIRTQLLVPSRVCSSITNNALAGAGVTPELVSS